MRVLAACERSGIVRDAFAARGHEAISCDLLPSDTPGPHYTGDVRDLLKPRYRWDLLVAFPPCTYLSNSGLHWNKRDGARDAKSDAALAFVLLMLDARIPRIAVENPVGLISACIGQPTQIIQPYDFGHDASKRTCLWLKNLPPLRPTRRVAPRMVAGKPRWSNQRDDGQNVLGRSKARAAIRSETYSGVARAMAIQWG